MPKNQRIEVIRPDWNAPDNIVACTTTRIGGLSEGCWNSLNLADHVGDVATVVQQNRSALNEFLCLPSEPVWLDQVHGCEVLIADELKNIPRSDASMTNQQGIVCAVLTADCLPLLLCNKAGDCIAAVHAGWRGLAAGIIEQTVLKIDCPSEEILVWLGPAIGSTAFEVGSEVRTAFMAYQPEAENAFIAVEGGKWKCDIYQLARQRLQSLGITHVSGGEYCSYRDSEQFFSYRRDGVTGRMASLIWIK